MPAGSEEAIGRSGFLPLRPGELARLRERERTGLPFLVYRDRGGDQRLYTLEPARDRVVIGRRPASDLALDWDEEVSRSHAALERIGEDWAVIDDGLSRNGTFVNGERVQGRRRLCDRDVLLAGQTPLLFRIPVLGASQSTVAPDAPRVIALSQGQRRVLLALCRPYAREPNLATPATNEQIAGELFLTVDTVKSHLRALFQKFGLDGLPQNQKRTRLARLALEKGLISVRELT